VCGKCKRVAYCCKEHQKEAWKHHKLVCTKTDAIDGWALAGLVYKTFESIDSRMDTSGYVRCEVRPGKEPASSDVTLVVRRVTDARIRSVDDFNDSDQHPLDECTEAWSRNRTLVYWAMRCLSLGCTLNYVFSELLCALWKQGYRFVVFGAAAVLPMEEPPVLELLKLKPRHTVSVAKIDCDAQTQPASVLHWVIVTANHVIDLAVGRFWVFCNAQDPRPLLVCTKRDYIIMVGLAEEQDKNIDKQATLHRELDCTAHALVVLGECRVAIEAYLTKSSVTECDDEEGGHTKLDSELLQWLKNRKLAELSQVDVDKLEEEEEEEATIITVIDPNAVKLKSHTGYTKNVKK
jgi:MYND finger